MEFDIRKAEEADSEDIFKWRNDPQSKAASLTTTEITWAEHQQWFKKALLNEDISLFFCEDVEVMHDERHVGIAVCRFSKTPGTSGSVVSININPSYRGNKLATPILSTAIEKFRVDSPDVKYLIAIIREENTASVKTFSKLGFTLYGKEMATLEYRLNLS